MADVILNRATYMEFPDNPEIDVSDLHIESGSLLLEEILCEGNIRFGETNATRFEATVYNLVDVSGLKIRVYQTTTDSDNRKYLFEGYVDSCKQDKFGYYRKLVAYDALYSIGNANVAGWWYEFWENSSLEKDSKGNKIATLKQLRESLCDWVGLSYDKSLTLFNDDFICTKTATLSSVSLNTVLFWICEIQCVVPHICRTGELHFISLNAKTPTDLTDQYEQGASEFEGFETALIDTVELYDYDNNLVATTNTTGAIPSKNIYVIKDNSLLFDLVNTADGAFATEFVQNYLTNISQIKYKPCTVEMIISNLDIHLGDYIQTSAGTHIVLQNTLSGSVLIDQQLKASGNEYLQDSSNTMSAEYLSIQKKTDDLKEGIITDDLLNYSHTNDKPYTIGSVVTPIIEVSVDMPNTSNLVFLATVNLESISNDTREITEEIIIDGEPHTVIRKEKVPVIVDGYFEWNDIRILTNKPTETYSEDGKHLLNLMFFSIGGRQAGSLSKFKVFLTVKHGTIHIEPGQINATIISKGSTAGNLPWDGTITVEELIKPVYVDKLDTNITKLVDSTDNTPDTPTPSLITEALGQMTVQPTAIQVSGITESIENT